MIWGRICFPGKLHLVHSRLNHFMKLRQILNPSRDEKAVIRSLTITIPAGFQFLQTRYSEVLEFFTCPVNTSHLIIIPLDTPAFSRSQVLLDLLGYLCNWIVDALVQFLKILVQLYLKLILRWDPPVQLFKLLLTPILKSGQILPHFLQVTIKFRNFFTERGHFLLIP